MARFLIEARQQTHSQSLCFFLVSNSGHMIKFQLFDSAQSYQCHFAEISTFVVSISHYMRAYFNYQALVNGHDFQLPADAAYLNVSVMQRSWSLTYILFVSIIDHDTHSNLPPFFVSHEPLLQPN